MVTGYSTPRGASTGAGVTTPRETINLVSKLAAKALKAPKKRSKIVDGGRRRRHCAYDPDNLTVSEFRMDARPQSDDESTATDNSTSSNGPAEPITLRQNALVNMRG